MGFSCVLCNGTDSEELLSLGDIYTSTFISAIEDEASLDKVPLDLHKCNKCGLVQLADKLELDTMYRQYFYRSGANPMMVNALHDIVESAKQYVPKYYSCLDIGCNDGTLLSFYESGAWKVGIDPANNLEGKAIQHADNFINDYFTDQTNFASKFDIITSIAMFYDVPNPNRFVEAITNILKPHGVWIIQMTDLTSMLEINAYDNICHEHYVYYTLRLMKQLLEKYGLEIFKVEYNAINGRSVRLYVGHAGFHRETVSVQEALAQEDITLGRKTIQRFESKILDINAELVKFLVANKHKNVYALGASTKGNTLLQIAGIDETHIKGILEISEDKIGKMTVGSHIPIIRETLDLPIDYILLLPWHFATVFRDRYKDHLDRGVKFIIPIPEPMLLGKDGYERIVR